MFDTARRAVALAAEVDRRPDLDAALAAGVVIQEQAPVIVAAVAELPGAAGAEVAGKAEAISANRHCATICN